MAQRFNHEALLRARLELDLTQEALAASVGVDVRTYRRYESGEVNEGGFSVRQPARRKLLERLGAELGLDPADLVIEAAPEPPPPLAPPEPKLFRPEFVHTLQHAPFFVGREDILAELWAWVEAPEKREGPGVVALVGVGGAGKTAIAERLIARFGDGPRPGGVFVWSFYDDERTEVFLAHAVRYFAGAEAPAGERLERLCAALGSGPPHLVVLDGLETVQAAGGASRAHGELEDPLLRRLLISLARGLGAARALVTSRFLLGDLAPWADGGARTVKLGPLSATDAERLLRSWGANADGDALARVVRASGGHALSLAVAGSYAGAFLGGDLCPLDPLDLAEAARDDPLARRLARVLSAYAAALPAAERDLLARLSALSAGADEDALLALASASPRVAGALAGASAEVLRRALARLERLGLVFRAGGDPPRFSSHPFVRDHFRSLLTVAPSAVQAAMTPPSEGTLIFAPRQKPRDASRLDALEEVVRALVAAGKATEAYRVYSQTMGAFSHLGLVLGEMSRGARILRLFGETTDPASPATSLPFGWRLSLLYERGLYAGALGDLVFALRSYAEHNRLVEGTSETSHFITGLRTLAYTERLAGALSAARAHASRSLLLAESAGLSTHVTRALALHAAITHDLGDVSAAQAGFARLVAMGDARVARRGLWEAEHLLALGELSEVVEMTEANVAACERLGWAGHAAQGHVLLGLAVADVDPAGAERRLSAARTWVAVSGEVEMAARVHELAARIALARGALFEAAREALTGERLAEACGLALFRARLFALGLEVALARGDEEAAERAKDAPRRVLAEDAWGRADVLHWAGLCLASAGDAALAQRYLEEALATRERLGHPGQDATRRALRT
ncbi:helix-turn-helix domain-containing protein [Polyangium spumosum]|uniref:Helix-turn-helix domain-containing protein n=1 Tax=Polyangium spumosum TaxID=889282 RepID=A0A6N7PV46_9BACT|nr:helix-turn-helix transcriptional regulator [Polyangium spumosum]MRG95863.1 helix-turn-helix domain-containing protein [Polyangium spumosum]